MVLPYTVKESKMLATASYAYLWEVLHPILPSWFGLLWILSRYWHRWQKWTRILPTGIKRSSRQTQLDEMDSKLVEAILMSPETPVLPIPKGILRWCLDLNKERKKNRIQMEVIRKTGQFASRRILRLPGMTRTSLFLPCRGNSWKASDGVFFSCPESTAFVLGSEFSLLTPSNPTWEVDRRIWFVQSAISSQLVHKLQLWV